MGKKWLRNSGKSRRERRVFSAEETCVLPPLLTLTLLFYLFAFENM